MIDISELRNDAKTAHYGHLPLEVSGSDLLELLDRLEAAEKERDNANAAAIGVALQADALQAEIDNIKEVQFDLKVSAVAEGWRGKCERIEKERDAAELMSLTLRAKIEQMEQQEPVAYMPLATKATLEAGGTGVVWNCRDRGVADEPLYALPGAQPAPSVPGATWLPVPDKHPTFDPVDLQLADGSVLCGCVPQSDGDYWWEGPSGEVFIDPRYVPVTHWRLSAAAPEAKP